MRAEVPPAAVKMLLLARWYGLAETALLEACQDRLSFRRFLDLPLEDDGVGDARLAEIYRRQVTQAPVEAQNVIHAIETQLLAKRLLHQARAVGGRCGGAGFRRSAPNDSRPVSGGTDARGFRAAARNRLLPAR